jgi:hypothetical protein
MFKKTSFRFGMLLVCLLSALSSYAQDLENIKNENPFEIHGSASASVGYYVPSAGFNSTRKPYSYSIMAAPIISIYGVQIPFNFTFTEGSKQVTNPFAQFGVNPSWRWIKGYAGWSNMSWSPTTLNGKTFLGIGVEINPSLFRFGAMYGRFNPAVKEDLTKNTVTPQYKRRGFAFKIGVGNEKNFFDFIFLKAKDVEKSIPTVSDLQNFPPQENAVFGMNSYQSFLKQKLVWQADGAISAYTRNLNSQLLDIGTGTGSKFLKVVIPPRLSTSYAWTAHTNLTYKTDKFSIGADYNRIQPEYQSMGVDYMLNDQQKITLSQSFNAAKNKVMVSFIEAYQHDNLNKRKAYKTTRTNFSSNIALNLSQKFGMVISYNNFVMFQQKGTKEVNDTTKLAQIQNLIVVTPRYTIINPKLVQNIFTSISYQRMDDLNDFTAKYTRNNTVNVNLGYTASVTKPVISVTPSFNILYSKTPLFELLALTPSLGYSQTFVKGKFTVANNFAFTISRQNNVWNSKTITNNTSLTYRFDNSHTLKLDNNLMRTFFLASGTYEYRGALTYIYTFNAVVKSKKSKGIPANE